MQVNDIAVDDLNVALHGQSMFYEALIRPNELNPGVGAVIHVASPLAGKAPPKEALDVSFLG